MKSTRCAAALAAAIALFSLQACGGVVHHLLDRDDDDGHENGQPVTTDPPVMSSAEIKAELHAIYDRSDTVIIEYGGRPLWTGPREAYETSNLDDLVAFELDGHHWGAPPNYDFLENQGQFEFAGSEGGISVAGAAWDATNPAFRSAVASVSLAAWMEHNFFLVNEDIALDPVDDGISVYLDIFSIGAASGRNPFPSRRQRHLGRRHGWH